MRSDRGVRRQPALLLLPEGNATRMCLAAGSEQLGERGGADGRDAPNAGEAVAAASDR